MNAFFNTSLSLSKLPSNQSPHRQSSSQPTMSKTNPSDQNRGLAISHYAEAFRKFKRFKYFEPSIGILGFFMLVFCTVSCFFYLDYRAVAKSFKFPLQSERFLWLQFDDGSILKEKNVSFLSETGGGCDVFEGDWVWDDSYPLYHSRNCSFLDEGFRCSENGRPDNFYTKWRWQPKHCNFPRFDAKLMLERLRNKRVVFAGDSIGRNQWESLLCMLSSGVPDQNSVYEVNGSPITKHKGFLVFKFKDYNFTVEYYRAPFLVLQSRPSVGALQKIRMTLKLDLMDWSSVYWKGADVLVLNTGHWWNYEKTIRGGCYFQEGEDVKMDMGVEVAYRRSIETVVEWINREIDTNKTQVFFRTYAPVHFSGGDWRTGGACHLETLPELGSSFVPSQIWPKFSIVIDVLSRHSHLSRIKDLNVLNVTYLTAKRKDGHASLYYLGPETGPAPVHRQDCSHWCLPGVPDAWNELLFALLLKRSTN